MRRSAFIPEEGDGKQCITKDESEMLRDSIISLTRPRISRPWFDRPPSPVDATTLIAKKNTSGGSARSNSSSGCSSDPQSGPSSPISSKCSSEGGSNARCLQSQQQQNGIIGQRQKEAAETAGLEVNRQPQMPSSSLILKVISSGQPTTATVNNNSGDRRTTAQIQQQQQQQPLLKRKDFPSYQRRRVCMPTPPTQHCQPKPTSICLPPSKVVGPTADEVEELSRAARKQMAILEELEVEDQERKTRITGHQLMATINSPTGSTSIRPLFHASSSTTSSPPSQSQPSSCSPSTSGSLKAGQSKPQMELARLLVEGQTRRRQSAAANEDQDRPKVSGGVERKQQQHQEVAAGLPHQLECKACGTMIIDVILQALGSSFHPACFRCSKCGKCLDGVPFAVDRAGAVICMEDYERHFVPRCQRCQKPISAVNKFGEVVRVVIQEREYHIQCYCCEGCGMQLSNEQQSRCYPLGDHLLCRRCHTLWRRMGALDSEAAVSDL